MMKFLQMIFCTLILLNLGACSHSHKKHAHKNHFLPKVSAEQMYKNAETSLARGYYDDAVKQLENLQAQYPYGEYSEQAQLDIIYAYYKAGDNASAVSAADRYTHLYPRSKHVDYAYYMKGVANFYQDRGVLAKYFPVNIAIRAQGTTTQAYEDFKLFIRRFPNSKYAADARKRMVYLRNMFASYELYVTEYYMKRHAYVAAANRATALIENFPDSPETKQALVYLVQANRKLGLSKEAENALRVLKHNYPGAKV